MTDQAVLDKLASADSPTIANIIEFFGLRSQVAGYTNDTIKAIYPDLPPVVGYAVTATFRSAYPPAKGPHGNSAAIIAAAKELPKPGMIVVQDLDEPIKSAVYGEVFVSFMKAVGSVGLITNGAGRDYLQVKSLDFPCFASGLIVAHGYCNILEAGDPVSIGGLDIRTGDLLHADSNGVVNIPDGLASHVAGFVDPFLESEQRILDLAQVSNPSLEKIQAEARSHVARVAIMKDEAKALIAT